MTSLLLLSLALAARADEGWTLPAPPPSASGAPTPPSESDPGAHEKLSFWDRLGRQFAFDGILEEVCRQVSIPADLGVGAGPVRAKPSYHRSLQRLPTRELALVDEAGLSVGAGYGLPIANVAGAGVSVSFGTSLDGRSMVIRPLGGKKTCSELARLADLRDVKTVLPLEAKRVKAMRVGEVWKAPIVLNASLSLGGGAPVGAASVSVAFGYSRQGGVSVSLNRLSEEDLRLRVRFDFAEVYGPSGGVALRVDGARFDEYRREGDREVEHFAGGFAGPLAAKGIDGLLLRPLFNYLTARLSLFAQWSDGDHALMEFVLDPTDDAQMAALERLLKDGDLRVLDSLWKGAKDVFEGFVGEAPKLDRFGAVERRYAGALDPKSRYAAQDKTSARTLGFGAKLPLLLDLSFSKGRQDDAVTVLDGEGNRFEIYRAHREIGRGTATVPFVGTLIRHNSRDSVSALAPRDRAEVPQPPVVVYVQQEGFNRVMDSIVDGMRARADAVMSLAGAPLPPARWEPTRLFTRGVMALTITLTEAAIESLKNADPEAVMKAYERAFPLGRSAGETDLLRRRGDAEAVVKDLRGLRASDNPAKSLRDLIAGAGRSSLAFDDAMKVLVQLIDPADLRAEFMMQAAGEGLHEKPQKVDERVVLHEDKGLNEAIRALNQALGRFAPPSRLTD